VSTWDSIAYRIIDWITWVYTLNFQCFGIEGCLKKGLSMKKALEALESLAVRSKAPDPVVATIAPKYLAESSRGIRGPGACGGVGEQIGHLHWPLMI
jgi:hypothetical protein